MIEHVNAQQRRYESGDRVRHRQRPEWGLGRVIKTEDLPGNGVRSQRLSVRFPNAGLKTLNTAFAELERVEQDADTAVEPPRDASSGTASGHAPPTGPGNGQPRRPARSRRAIVHNEPEEEHWLTPIAAQQLEKQMLSIPEQASDPFSSMRRRLQHTFDLYRFDRSGKGLMEWAIAQTGLDDPLSRFTRHELEQKFDRWSAARDEHLKSLLQDDECDEATVRELLEQAPTAARDAVRRVSARR